MMEPAPEGRGPGPEGAPLACVILATDTSEADAVDAITRKVVDLGLHPVVAVVPKGMAVTAPARALAHDRAQRDQHDTSRARRDDLALLRLGLTQLTNSPVRGALVWPAAFPKATPDSARAVLAAARRNVAPVIVPAYRTRPGLPAFFSREVWLDVMTASDGDLGAIAASFGRRALDVAVNDPGVVERVSPSAPGSSGEERHALP